MEEGGAKVLKMFPCQFSTSFEHLWGLLRYWQLKEFQIPLPDIICSFVFCGFRWFSCVPWRLRFGRDLLLDMFPCSPTPDHMPSSVLLVICPFCLACVLRALPAAWGWVVWLSAVFCLPLLTSAQPKLALISHLTHLLGAVGVFIKNTAGQMLA